MSKYYFENGLFIIEDYDKVKPFSSFLPAIAGKMGIPLWCYYVNRGQGVCSFGLRDKNGAILEFSPANVSYREVDKLGFRTFIKVNGKFYEPFNPKNTISKRKMMISKESFQIEEINEEKQIKVKVTYFGLPNETIGALVRKVEITNLGDEVNLEVCDGLDEMLATGVNEWTIKHQSNLLRSWMDVEMLENNIAFYKLNSVPGDESEVQLIESGNYFFSFTDNGIIKPIYDSVLIYGLDTTMSVPLNFVDKNVDDLLKMKQVGADKVGVAFCAESKKLDKNETLVINEIYGFTPSKEIIEQKALEIIKKGYIEEKQIEAKKIIEELTEDVYIKTNYPLFDEYIKQNYLDNILRGGYPQIFKSEGQTIVYHLFSRRHGDLEREYNFFSIAPEFYSQGNGNFRDVCQNRRSDNLFVKEVEIYNAKVFANLIQLDGYNPLAIQGSTFNIKDKQIIKKLVEELFINGHDLMKNILSNSFTPGLVINTIYNNNIMINKTSDDILNEIMKYSHQEINAQFGEGYWVDHWTYILDLVENALKIYPEKKNEYLFDDYTYRYFESPATVLPRDQKYCLDSKGNIRQYGAILDRDEEKIAKLKLKMDGSSWAKLQNSDEEIKTNMYGKLFTLGLLKYATLDPLQIGIEMEANKPGWNDAMNGLPGLMASGISETIELKRLLDFLSEQDFNNTTILPVEVIDLAYQIKRVYDEENDSFSIWELVSTLRENYRDKTRFGALNLRSIQLSELEGVINQMKKIIIQAINKATSLKDGIIPSYLIYTPTKYELTNKIGNYKLPTVKVLEFKMRVLPLFLEAPARFLKLPEFLNNKKEMYEKIKITSMYDQVLKCYRTSEDLDDEGFSIGRIRAFQKGWLERESNFLHMTYKYLLGLLKTNMYKEFYEEIKTNLVCFMDPAIYGRSTLENSSFIATSNNPDEMLWGQGFVSRLSGSTAEMLSIYHLMMFGKEPFTYNDELKLELKPILKKDFFKYGVVEAKFLSHICVNYINPKKIDLIDKKPLKYELINSCECKEVSEIIGNDAIDVRNLKYSKINVYF